MKTLILRVSLDDEDRQYVKVIADNLFLLKGKFSDTLHEMLHHLISDEFRHNDYEAIEE